MIIYKSLLTFLLCSLASAFLLAQEGIIKGKVYTNNEDLSAATVTLENKTMLTDSSGRFSFIVKAGNYKLVVTHTGYKRIEKEIKIEVGQTLIVDFLMLQNEQLGEVVVVGSRSFVQRINLNTPVPVDVFPLNRLIQTGQISLTQMLNVLAPSFNASREMLNEPASLRGLDPQHVLILLNGVRYHNMAWYFGGGLKGQLGRGSVGNDLNSIPFSAIEKIEILRDGAAAQYGSDAVAGVINIRLKEATGKTSIRLHTGQYYKSDGEKFLFGINHGFSINKKGFLNFSLDYRYQKPTFRGGEYQGTLYSTVKAIDDSIIKARNFKRQWVFDNIGNFKIISVGALANGGYALDNRTELFWTATINQRKVDRDAGYLFPKDPRQVNLKLYPDGFQPVTKNSTVDISALAGIKSYTKNNGHWDFTSSYGENSNSSGVTNSNNASQTHLGKDAPTSFYTGKIIYQQLTNNANFSKRYLHSSILSRSLNIGIGGEWRLEKYRTVAGEEASWENYDTSGRTFAGSQGNSGIHPQNVVNKNRNVLSTYLDIETELNKHFLLDVAVRYEYYSDFGGNLAGKLAARYKISERIMLRASANSGFRAPSQQQRYATTKETTFVRMGGMLVPAVRGLFPNDHQVAKALGIPSLTAEKTFNVSGGLTAKLHNRISLTVDAYWIQIKNRIILSGSYSRNNSKSIDSVLKINTNFNQITQVQFFSNAINTRTYGIDLVLNGSYHIGKSNFHYTLAANLNRTNIFGEIQTPLNIPSNEINTNILFNRADQASVEKGQPQDKVMLNMNYQKGKIDFKLTNTRFGRTIVFSGTNPTYDEFFTPKILTDVSLNYQHKSWLTITFGANNILNVYPDPLKHYSNTNQGIFIYSPEASPFGFNGGYYFISMNFTL